MMSMVGLVTLSILTQSYFDIYNPAFKVPDSTFMSVVVWRPSVAIARVMLVTQRCAWESRHMAHLPRLLCQPSLAVHTPLYDHQVPKNWKKLRWVAVQSLLAFADDSMCGRISLKVWNLESVKK